MGEKDMHLFGILINIYFSHIPKYIFKCSFKFYDYDSWETYAPSSFNLCP